MAPASVTRIQLHQIARQDQDAIIFDASGIQSLTAETDVFLIFYLSKEDEYNGYGTVIQLDPQTKQAVIYADLNPEYTYLFFKNNQGQLQSLLWCIEVATRTSDGLFIAHAKSYGRGISQEDIQRFNQVNLPQNQPETERKLAETYTPQSAPATDQTPASPAGTPSFAPTPTAPAAAPAAASAAPTQPATPPVNPTPAPSATPTVATPVSPEPTPQNIPAPAAPITMTSGEIAESYNPPAPAAEAPTLPLNSPTPSTTVPYQELNLPPLPAVSPTKSPAITAATESLPNLAAQQPTPPNPAVPNISSPDPAPPAALPTIETTPANPAPLPGIPDIFSSMPPSSTPAATQPDNFTPTPKQPVGRPPKPLLQEQLWLISPEDFSWVKTVSRLPIDQFTEELRQRIIKQIRQNKPGLVEDWQFHGAFEQAFIALCTTYDLIPALRHDILKALLNGRVVEAVYRNMTAA